MEKLATLLLVHYSKRAHLMPGTEKHGVDVKNHVSKSIRSHYMTKILKY